MSSRGIDEKSIKQAVAERARDFGDQISDRDVRLTYMDGEAAPGCLLFHASWGGGRREQAITGLLRDGDPPDTFPGRAMAKIFQRWLETAGTLPEGTHAPRVAAYLYDPLEMSELIQTAEDIEQFIKRPEWQPYIQLPKQITVAGQPGIRFWWIVRGGPAQMSVYLLPNGRIRTEEKFILEYIEETGARA